MEKMLQNLRDVVFSKQTVLAEIYRNDGQKTLAEYVSGWDIGRLFSQEVLLKNLEEVCSRIYGPHIAAEVVSQIKSEPIVSTIDHHGILNHPIFVNANLIYSLKPARYLVCLSTAGVSLNNTTSWSGCLLLHEGSQLRRLSFFRDKQKTQAVLSTEKFGRSNVERVISMIEELAFLDSEKKANLRDFIANTVSGAVIDAPNFSTQASLMSTALWQAVFPDAAQVIYIPIEELVTRIIVKGIAQDPKHILHNLLFNVEGWDLVERYFTGSLGAFTSGHKGSFLYWGVSEKRRRTHLIRKGSKLMGHGFEVAAGHAAIVEALEKGFLYPTSLVCFLVMLYYGMTCVGGFNQVNWLTNIKSIFTRLLREMGLETESKRIEGAVTNNFAEGTLAFLPNGNPATGVDLLLAGSGNWYTAYSKLAKSLRVGESIDIQLPEIYKVITPSQERNPELLSITEASILDSLGIRQKIEELTQV